MHLDAVAANCLVHDRDGLFHAIRVQLHPGAARAHFLRDCQEAAPSHMQGPIAETGEAWK